MTRPLPVAASLATQEQTAWQSFKAARKNVLGIVPEILREVEILSDVSNRFKRWHMLAGAADLRHVLLTNVGNYPKSGVVKNIFRPAIGDSLLIAEGDHWKWQRKISAPVFSKRNISTLTPIIHRHTGDFIRNLDDGEHNVSALMAKLTFDIIAEITFSDTPGFDAETIHRGIEDFIERIARVSFLDILGAPEWVPRPGRLLNGGGFARLRRSADGAIDHRRQHGGADRDLLGMLVRAQNTEIDGRKMTTEELRQNLLAFIAAGHETTAVTLSWALYLLANEPEIQEKARDASAHENNPYIRAVIMEALRLYPPAAFLSRTAQGPDTLSGREIRKGDTVMLPVYAIGRHKKHWHNPDAFMPERFEDGLPVDRFLYLPFGDGPRICIGAELAMIEATHIITAILRNYRVRLPEGFVPEDIEPVLKLTLRPKTPITLNFSRI